MTNLEDKMIFTLNITYRTRNQCHHLISKVVSDCEFDQTKAVSSSSQVRILESKLKKLQDINLHRVQ